jgi:hypothetical protein
LEGLIGVQVLERDVQRGCHLPNRSAGSVPRDYRVLFLRAVLHRRKACRSPLSSQHALRI